MSSSPIITIVPSLDLQVLEATTPNGSQSPVLVGAYVRTANFPSAGYYGPLISRDARVIESALPVVRWVSWVVCGAFGTAASPFFYRFSQTADFPDGKTIDVTYSTTQINTGFPSRAPRLEGNWRFCKIFHSADFAMTHQILFYGNR